MSAPRVRPRIVIVGGGFGGAYCATGLARRLRPGEADVLLIDRHNYFVFHPLLVEAGTGGLEPRHVVVPIRDFIRRGHFRMAEVVGVNRDDRVVEIRSGDGSAGDDTESLPFDHLVIACGSVTRMPPLPGVRVHAHPLKNLADAVALRDRAIGQLEYASAEPTVERRRRRLQFAVVGGNFTGVEVAGEFDELLRRASRRYPTIGPEDCSMTLIEMTDRILAPLGPELSEFARRHLERRGVTVRLRSAVAAVDAEGITLAGGERVPATTIIWCAGIEPNPLIGRLDVPRDERGYIECDRTLAVRGCDGLWAIGDGAVNADAEGRAYPATAQHAVRQGAHLARNLVATLRGQAPTPCDLGNLGSLAAIGCRTGVARVFGIKVAGFPAWWLWRTVYLLKMPRLGRKIRVVLDWTIGLFFRRDFVQLGVHAETPSASPETACPPEVEV